MEDNSLTNLAGLNDIKYIVNGNKLTNEFLRSFTEGLREDGVEDSLILDMILNLDEDTENGKLSNESILNEVNNIT